MTREIKNEFPACPEDFVLTEELKQEFNLSIAKYLGESRDTSYVLYLIMNSFSRLCFFLCLFAMRFQLKILIFYLGFIENAQEYKHYLGLRDDFDDAKQDSSVYTGSNKALDVINN